jgi:predicted Zn-dependent protease
MAVKTLEVQILYSLKPMQTKELKHLAKELISQSTFQNLEALALLAQLHLDSGKASKAFTLLNHCLKYDYRNPDLWTLLGNAYTTMMSSSPEESEYKIEKSVFCFGKALKYSASMSQECRRLLRLLPKCVY